MMLIDVDLPAAIQFQNDTSNSENNCDAGGQPQDKQSQQQTARKRSETYDSARVSGK